MNSMENFKERKRHAVEDDGDDERGGGRQEFVRGFNLRTRESGFPGLQFCRRERETDRRC